MGEKNDILTRVTDRRMWCEKERKEYEVWGDRDVLRFLVEGNEERGRPALLGIRVRERGMKERGGYCPRDEKRKARKSLTRNQVREEGKLLIEEGSVKNRRAKTENNERGDDGDGRRRGAQALKNQGWEQSGRFGLWWVSN